MAKKKGNKKTRTRTVRTTTKSAPYRRKKKSRSSSKWFPDDFEGSLYNVAAGAIAGPLNQRLSGVQQQYLGAFGEYTDEATLAGVGVLMNRFGGSMKPVKKLGKGLWNAAMIGAGAGAGSSVVDSLLGNLNVGGKSSRSDGSVKVI